VFRGQSNQQAFVVAYLDRGGAVTAIDGRSVRIGLLDIRCDPDDPRGLLRLVTEAEAIESVLRRRAVAPFTNPEGRGSSSTPTSPWRSGRRPSRRSCRRAP